MGQRPRDTGGESTSEQRVPCGEEVLRGGGSAPTPRFATGWERAAYTHVLNGGPSGVRCPVDIVGQGGSNADSHKTP